MRLPDTDNRTVAEFLGDPDGRRFLAILTQFTDAEEAQLRDRIRTMPAHVAVGSLDEITGKILTLHVTDPKSASRVRLMFELLAAVRLMTLIHEEVLAKESAPGGGG